MFNKKKKKVNERLELMRQQSRSIEEFRERAERELINRHFLLSYQKRNLQLHSLDWSQSEHSSFELQSGGKISYKDYLQKTYGIKSPKQEMCVVKDKGGAVFLPQHIRLTITSKQSDAVYENVLEYVNPSTKERLSRIEDFVQQISQHHSSKAEANKKSRNKNKAKDQSKSNSINSEEEEEEEEGKNSNVRIDVDNESDKLDIDFEIEEESMTTPAYVLQMPKIIIYSDEGPIENPVDNFKYSLCRGFLDGTKQLRQWGVVFESNPRDRTKNDEKSYQSFVYAWEEYCKKRRFDFETGPILCPQPRPVSDLMDESFYNDTVRRGDEFLVLILPEGIRGSEVKARFTKAVQKPNFPVPVMVQCIQAATCNNNNACLGTFEDIMIKFGNVPYRINPCLPHGATFINPNDCWVVGVDVSHVVNKPSVVMISLSRDPFQGSLRQMHFLCHLNPSRKEIVGFSNMVNVMYQVLEEGYQATLREKKSLPGCIWIFRDGVADGQIQELFTKEVVGIQRALSMFRDAWKLKKWRPALEYLLCNKNTIDRFGKWDEHTVSVRQLDVPCVVFDHVLSDRLWDFIIFGYHRSKKEKTRPVRYIVLLDGLNLANDKAAAKGSAMDLFQFVFGLTYMFAFSVPFPLGGTAQPSPIQYAKHYAESFSQTILASDRCLKDLNTSEKLNRPHVVTDLLVLIKAFFMFLIYCLSYILTQFRNDPNFGISLLRNIHIIDFKKIHFYTKQSIS
ncbi:Argonaute-2b [Reticulomyxa filosa]|uniref:Argonaute-2b n=1 Tax=Reticulomyxa filosa TaxID=46433 RepID=X6P615_RETFI|nr:Argonaute-2b [Reticulomyxa filosa]|eukprot:ETO33529.1 Argonaute-2b [Reticulomyxa filosa]